MTDTPERPIVVTELVSLDGYIVGPDEDMSWVAVGFDPQMQDDIAVDLRDGYDTFLLGRVTYEIFSAYWPHAQPYEEGDALKPAEGKEDPRVIRAMNETEKVVFSSTLVDPAWSHTRVVTGGLEDEVRRLKRQPGGAIGVQGSASVVAALVRADLVDRYRLYLHPVVLGAGTPLHPEGHGRQDFALTDLTRYDNGVVLLTYERSIGSG